MRLIIFFVLTIIVAGFAKAQDSTGNMPMAVSSPSTITLNLQKAEELALAGNPYIQAADKRAEASTKQASQSLAPADPVFSIDQTSPGMNNWYIDEDLGFPGRSFAQADVNGAESKKMGAKAQNERREILFQARQAFWEFYFRQKVYDLLQEAQGRLKDFGEALESQNLSGQWLSMKAVRMQMETAKAANELLTTSKALQISRYGLNHLFNLPHETTYVLSGNPPLIPFTGQAEDYIRKAIAENPELNSYRIEVEAQQARHNLAALNQLPSFSLRLSGARNPQDNGFSGYGFMASVSLPVFFPLKQTQALDQTGDELDAARDDLKGQENETAHMVEDAVVEAQSDWRLLQLYEQGGLLKQTQKAWEASESAYRNGEMSLSELLEDYNTYLETVTNDYQTQADYGKALAQLDYAVGETPENQKSQGGI